MQANIRELKKRIRRNIPQLTKSQKILANYIVENPQKFAISTARELEKELNISKSTIVRFSQLLGYNGFLDLRSKFLSGIRRDISPIKRYKDSLSEPSEKVDYLSLISNENITNIQNTLSLIDREQYNKAVAMIKESNQVYTVGLGISAYLAEITSYLFNLISIKANYMIYRGLTFTEQIVNLNKEDIIVAFSFPAYSPETIEAACYAQEKKIGVIAITDKVTSEIVQYSNVVLHVDVDSITISNSICGVLTILYALVTQIGHDIKNRAIETIESIEHVRESRSCKKVTKI